MAVLEFRCKVVVFVPIPFQAIKHFSIGSPAAEQTGFIG